ncbi:PREDICTED: RNA polymerase II-associated factor 1 homolog [Bactrocera latifrons]|uniref:RNA polymerase II-associated factor 1 homolog n=1 Tax=Bactrocera latifrons TaxID=174628 RepID=A0A0K8V9X4_BACLA|nr:PREDICTED: RNA polymerase II-associated factor 1 homolog [Bactrocera latifrons]
MAPTIINTTSNAEKRPVRAAERKSELICRVKYGNSLPDIPFDLKFLQYPFDSNRFVQYNPTSLERNYKYEVLTEHDLGVTIDLINRDLYQADPYAQLDPADERLLEEDVHTPHDSMRSRQHSRSVSWLRKSEYISTEQTRFQPQNLENIEAKVGYNVKKSLREETLYLDRDAQIKAIEKTFSDSKHEISKHYSKPNVVPVEIMPVYPDFKNWKYPCAQVIFDSDPAPAGKNVPAQLEEMSQAMIRGVMDESGEQFVAYFLPTEETLDKRRNDFAENVLYKDDEDYEYKIAREYNWNVKSKASKGYEENYFFVVRQDGVFYNELETRVRLNKRRVKTGQQPSNTKLVVKHRPLDANEHRMQRYREKQLEPAGDEEDEEMEEDEEDEEEMATTTQTTSENNNNKGGDADDGDESEHDNAEASQKAKDRQSRSRSKSHAKSKSRSRSRSSSGSRSGSGSRASHSRSRSKSGSRSRSGSRSTAQSRSRSRSASKSPSRSRSATPAGSHKSISKSRSRSASHTSRSPSRSVSRSRSRSRSNSGSRSPSKTPARSRSRSRSGSRSGSASGSRSGSASRTPSRSGSATPSGSDSGSGSGSEAED